MINQIIRDNILTWDTLLLLYIKTIPVPTLLHCWPRLYPIMFYSLLVSFHKDFLLAMSSLNNENQLIRYNNQLTVVELCFTIIAATQTMGVL